MEVASQPDASIVYDGKPASTQIKLQGAAVGTRGR
jgi:hypothetical protein